jgi:hypothetical protein
VSLRADAAGWLLLAKAPSGGGSCTTVAYGWSGTQADTSFTVPANCPYMIMSAWGSGAAGTTGAVGQGGNGGASGEFVSSGIAVTPGATVYINVGAEGGVTCISTATGCTGTVYVKANAASGTTAGAIAGSSCSGVPCAISAAGTAGRVSTSTSLAGAGGSGAPGSNGLGLLGGATGAAQYGGAGGGGSNGSLATTPTAATNTTRAGGQGGDGTGAGTAGTTGTHTGGNGTAGSGGGGGGGYGSSSVSSSGPGGNGAVYNGAYLTTASTTGTAASGTYLDGGGGGGGSGGVQSGGVSGAGGAGGGCGAGGGGGGGVATSGTGGAAGAAATGCVFAQFSATPTYRGPAEIYGAAVAYYGTRCYSVVSVGNIVDVVDTATGTVGTRLKCGFGGTISEVVSSTACTFVGGNTCSPLATTCATSCDVSTLYNQSYGTGRYLNQLSSPARPVYTTSCIGTKPCVNFTAANSEVLDDGITWTSVSQPYTVVLSYNSTTNAASSGILGNNSAVGVATKATNTLHYYFNVDTTISGVAINTVHNVVLVAANPSACASDVDGTTVTGTNCGTTAWSTMFRFGYDGNSYMQGTIQEAAIYPVAFTTGAGSQAENMVTNMAAYWQ